MLSILKNELMSDDKVNEITDIYEETREVYEDHSILSMKKLHKILNIEKNKYKMDDFVDQLLERYDYESNADDKKTVTGLLTSFQKEFKDGEEQSIKLIKKSYNIYRLNEISGEINSKIIETKTRLDLKDIQFRHIISTDQSLKKDVDNITNDIVTAMIKESFKDLDPNILQGFEYVDEFNSRICPNDAVDNGKNNLFNYISIEEYPITIKEINKVFEFYKKLPTLIIFFPIYINIVKILLSTSSQDKEYMFLNDKNKIYDYSKEIILATYNPLQTGKKKQQDKKGKKNGRQQRHQTERRQPGRRGEGIAKVLQNRKPNEKRRRRNKRLGGGGPKSRERTPRSNDSTGRTDIYSKGKSTGSSTGKPESKLSGMAELNKMKEIMNGITDESSPLYSTKRSETQKEIFSLFYISKCQNKDKELGENENENSIIKEKYLIENKVIYKIENDEKYKGIFINPYYPVKRYTTKKNGNEIKLDTIIKLSETHIENEIADIETKLSFGSNNKKLQTRLTKLIKKQKLMTNNTHSDKNSKKLYKWIYDTCDISFVLELYANMRELHVHERSNNKSNNESNYSNYNNSEKTPVHQFEYLIIQLSKVLKKKY